MCYNCGTVLHETFAKLFDGTILHYIICLKSPATMLIRLYHISQIIVFPSRTKSHLVSLGRIFAGVDVCKLIGIPDATLH